MKKQKFYYQNNKDKTSELKKQKCQIHKIEIQEINSKIKHLAKIVEILKTTISVF